MVDVLYFTEASDPQKRWNENAYPSRTKDYFLKRRYQNKLS